MTPLYIFSKLYSKAKTTEVVLATVGKDLHPSARVVLLKYFDEKGLVFFTNNKSRKIKELSENHNCSMLFYWPQIQRQVRVEGKCLATTRQETIEYFSSRTRESRIGAWASIQSQVMSKPDDLQTRFSYYSQEFLDLEEIPVPEFWSGYRLSPQKWEFWQEGNHRLHNRTIYLNKNGVWKRFKLFP